MMMKVYGVIGDCPALNLVLNHKSHVGYSCCCYCNVHGEHIANTRQYYYDANISHRNKYDFEDDSRRAERLRKAINGRHGVSILTNILDISLPYSIIADYLHVTLLRHGKTICTYLYKKVLTPKKRLQLDEKISMQRFPHFFHRTIRPLNKCFLK
jgi:hypothetical protein